MDTFTGLTGKTIEINRIQKGLVASLTAIVLTGCATAPAPEVAQHKPTAKRGAGSQRLHGIVL